MAVKRGEIVALLGENGAGKSTLIKILAGVYAVDTGTVSYEGNDMTSAVRRMPIAFIHQDLGLIEWMTVTENICLTLGYPRRFGLIEWSKARKRAELALTKLGIDIDPDLRMRNLTRRRNRWLRSPARLPRTPRYSFLTSRPRAFQPTRSCDCSRRSVASASMVSA